MNKELLERLEAYREEKAQKQKKEKVLIIMYLVICIPLYLYLRLFNTKFQILYNEISLQYSTAWFVQYPAQIDGKEIDCIQNWNVSERAPHMLFVSIEEGIKEIRSNAFAECEWLTKVIIPESVEDVGEGLFEDCKNLRYVELSDSIEHLGDKFFYGCRKLEGLVFPSELRSITPTALEKSGMWKKEVSELNLPESVYFVCTQKNIYYDIEKEHKYLFELTGIPLEVLEHSVETNDVWIEGIWYKFPMTYNGFTQKDSWEVIESEKIKGDSQCDKKYTLNHIKTNRKIKIYTKNDIVKAISLSDGWNNPCQLVMSGLVCNASEWYRGFAIEQNLIKYFNDKVSYQIGYEAFSLSRYDLVDYIYYKVGSDNQYTVEINWDDYSDRIDAIDISYD